MCTVKAFTKKGKLQKNEAIHGFGQKILVKANQGNQGMGSILLVEIKLSFQVN